VWWSRHLKPALFARLVPDPAVRALMVPGDVDAILAVIEAPDARFGVDPVRDRDTLLATTLEAAFADCTARLGPNTAGWAWGRLHHAAFEHPLAGFAGAGFAGADAAALNVGPFPHGGSGQTPMHTGYRPADFRTIAGASVRMVIDVGNWDASRAINAPGQSGDPRSPHYRDLAPLWAQGQYVPLCYSRDAVDAAAALRIVLTPA
jgi:penicillin amidase